MRIEWRRWNVDVKRRGFHQTSVTAVLLLLLRVMWLQVLLWVSERRRVRRRYRLGSGWLAVDVVVTVVAVVAVEVVVAVGRLLGSQ